MMRPDILGVVHVYDKETDTTSVSWSYPEDDKIEYFVVEYYDEAKREWVAYDHRMGIVEKKW